MSLAILLSTSLRALPVPPSTPPEEDKTESNVELNGEQIYQKECSICHGSEGQGTARGYPLNLPYRPFATHITRQGRIGNAEFAIPMPAYAETEISDRQLAEIWNYLDSIAQRTSGAELYQSYCANCHGRDAKGGSSAKALGNSLNSIEVWIRWGNVLVDYEFRNSYMPQWNKWEISDVEIEKIQAHVQSLIKNKSLQPLP